MRNIGELIGIIKGINFDNVINELEVEKLQNWVDKNRNLAYEPKQIELIKLIDDILEDHIIEENEKEFLLEYCEEYHSESFDEFSKIYELNGIIDGIVCDGVVNEPEVIKLGEWVKRNSFIKTIPALKVLCSLIDDILEDGIVTEEEQKTLLDALSDYIGDMNLNTKIEYLRREVIRRHNIGIDLIDILDNENAIERINKLAQDQIRRSFNSYTSSSVRDSEIVLISLSLIAMLYYDGNFYDHVRDCYEDLYTDYKEQKIEGTIRTVLCRYRKKDENSKRFINVALRNAIVPSVFLKSFFEFIYDIYKLNFECDLPDDLFEEFQFVFDGLRNSMLSDSDELEVNVTKKTYKLIKSTKELITDPETVEYVIKLSIIIVNIIDKHIWNKELKFFNPYLKNGYECWVKTLSDEDKHRKGKKSELKSRWEPKYILITNNVFLVPPVHRIKSQYDYKTIRIEIENGSEIYTIDGSNLDIREIIGGYQISIDKVYMQNPLGNVRYRLYSGEEVIYDSREKLYRDYLVFDQNGKEIKNNTDYSGTATFCIPNNTSGFKTFVTKEHYCLAALNVNIGDAFYIDSQIFNFSAYIKPGVFGEERIDGILIDLESEKRIKVFSEIKCIAFEAENSISNFEIQVDGVRFKLDDFNVKKTSREGVNKYILDPCISEDGIHTIRVNGFKEGVMQTILPVTMAVLDSKLILESVKLQEGEYLVSVHSGLLDAPITQEIYLEDIKDYFTIIQYNEKDYGYALLFNFDTYRIDSGLWSDRSREIWIDEIRADSFLDVYGNGIEEVKVYGSDGALLNENIKLRQLDTFQRMDIGFLATYKALREYALLTFIKNEKVAYSMFIYYKSVMRKEETIIECDPNTSCLRVIPSFYGKGRVYFKVYDKNGELGKV